MNSRPTIHRIFLFSLSLLLLQGKVQAQSLKDFFNDPNTTLFYFGIDFTKNRVIGDYSASPLDIVARQYTGLNMLMLDESKKYDIKAAYYRTTMNEDLNYVNKRNESVDPNTILSTNAKDLYRLNQDSINALIKGYNFGTNKGIGLVIVMEAMSKSDKVAAAWFTLVDIVGKKVLMTERLEGKVGMGFSFRNYWATAIKKMIDEVEKKKYKEWKGKYGS
ncbi:MAG: hypothetical protein ACHQEM_03495 [Chitinophagales bacterium]